MIAMTQGMGPVSRPFGSERARRREPAFCGTAHARGLMPRERGAPRARAARTDQPPALQTNHLRIPDLEDEIIIVRCQQRLVVPEAS